MNKILKKIGEKIKQFVKFKSKLSEEEKNSSVGTFYFNGQEIGHIHSFSARVTVSPSLKRMCKRIIENKKLFNILRHTRKNRTKKKLAKRINKNNRLNKLDK